MKKIKYAVLMSSIFFSASAFSGVYVDREQIHERNISFHNFSKKDDMISYHNHVEKDTRFVPLIEFNDQNKLELSDKDTLKLYFGYEIERKITSGN